MTDGISRLNAALEGRYRIERKIGEGGMATVYLAQDERHKRPVALKVLKPDLAAVVGAERFLAEIETTANLQDPHILPLFDSGEADGFLFYVMPYIEGETLRERIERERQLPVDEALGIATAVAHALHTAHEAGVVHRDIKPGNILLSRGEPLVADFGIALAVGGASGTRLTETGLSVGTPYYMSPEQARGDQVVGPFSATAVRRSIPLNVDAAIRKALEKLPADRFRTAKEFANALVDPSFRYGESSAGVAAAVAGWRRAVYGLAALSLVLALLSGWALTRSEPPAPAVHASILLPEPRGGIGGTMALSPDGSLLVYEGPPEEGEARSQLWLRRWSDLSASPIPGTEGAMTPSISPDGREVAFLRLGSRTLMATSLEGGVPRTLVESGGLVGEWSADGFIYFTALETVGIARVPADGGAVEMLTEPAGDGSTGHYDPVRIEGHDVVLFGEFESSEWFIRALDLSSGQVVAVTSGGGSPRYLPTGHLAYLTVTGELVVAPFDPGRMEMTGPALPMARNVAFTSSQLPKWALSETGTVVYPSGGSSGRFQALWVERNGAATPIDPSWAFNSSLRKGLALSPDGSRLAITIFGEGAEDIWIKELPDGPLLRLTSDSAQDIRPRWTRDGRVTFISERDGAPAKVYALPADGTGSAELILEHESALWEAQVSSDGEWVVARARGQPGRPGGRDVIGTRRGDDGQPVPLIATGFDEKAIRLSPDGRWLAYDSDRTGRNEVYVRPFPDVDAGLFAVSVDGGIMPLWDPDGDAIYYVTSAKEMVEAQIVTEPSFSVTDREVLFTIGPDMLIPQREYYALYDITPDGERFVMLGLEESEDAEVILITNWFTEVEERVRR